MPRRIFAVDIPFRHFGGNNMELMIPLNTQDQRPLYEQIYQYIKNEIRTGNLRPMRQLPSTRDLAKSLKVSRSTTQLAYEQLVSEGYVESVPRKGYFTASLEGILPPVPTAGGARSGAGGTAGKCQSGNAESKMAGEDWENTGESGEGENDGWTVDFSPRGIDLDSFPFSTWRRISRAVLREEEKELFLKGDSMGDLPLREALKEYLHAARGVNCRADQILVGAGSEYLLMLLSQLLGAKTRIAMENPTYKQAYRVLKGMGHPICPVDMDKNGLMTEALLGLPVSAVYVMPSHQFPTGIVMPVKRRQELLSWAERETGRYIIEDDYDSEFRYKGKPIPALQGMDRNDCVIYMGTFSKSIAPAIRIGYMVLPESLLKKYKKETQFYSSTVSRVDQRILSQFITGGFFERHLNRMREIYKGKHDILLSALKPLEKYFEIGGEFAGLHVLLTCKGERQEEELVKAAEQTGVKVYGLSGFFIHKEHERRKQTVILGYARLGEEEIREGAALLVKAWKE